MIKAIFFDVDGTLISKSRSVLSEGVIAALKQLQEKGIKLFIASGRHYLESVSYTHLDSTIYRLASKLRRKNSQRELG